jgi:hypothetical protein
MSDPLLLIEPHGHASRLFMRLGADRLRSESEIRSALKRHGRRALWIAPSSAAVHLLLGIFPRRPTGDQRLLSLERAHDNRHGLLHALFRFVVSVDEGVRLLPADELSEVLSSANRADLFIGVAVSPADAAAIVYRGNLEPLVVPLTWFRERPDGPIPDRHDVAITDFGQTIRLGTYEAAANALLYEFDEDYRRRAKKRQVETDRSLGGALRRLRLQKGLRQGDFPGVTAKEIARIERGEVKKPHQHTLTAIAKRMGVSADDILTY